MLKKYLAGLFFALMLILVGLGIFIYYSYQPALAPQEFPHADIIHHSEYESSSPQNQLLKIATFNMGYASGDKNNKGRYLTKSEAQDYLNQIAKVLRELNPDLLLVQEIDFYSHRSFDQNQLEYLIAQLQMPYAAYAVNWNKKYLAWPYWPVTRHFGRIVSGQAIISRWPLSNQNITRLPKPKDNPFWYNWFYIDRLIQGVDLRWQEKTISVYNVHLEAFDRPARLEQINRLAERLKGDPHRLKLVGGDFNSRWTLTTSSGPEVAQERADLRQWMEKTGLHMVDPEGGHLTFPSWEPQKDLDYLFYSDGFKEKNSSVIPGLMASDHLLRWALIEWTGR